MPSGSGAAALLHDIEDTDVTITQVQDLFGQEVAQLVAGATEKYKLQKDAFNEKNTWKESKQHTIDFITSGATPDQMLIICADKLDNIRSVNADLSRLGETIWSRFNAGQEEQSWHYHALLDAFTQRKNEFPQNCQDLVPLFQREVHEVFALD